MQGLSLCGAARGCARPCAALRRAGPEAGRPARADRRDRRRVRRLLLRRRLCRACGRSRCRCRPASAAAKPMSTSCACMLKSSDPSLFLCPPELLSYARRGRRADRGVAARDWDSLDEIEPATGELPTPDADDIAYLQYSSGSTRFPHGVAVTHRAAARQPPRPRPRPAGRGHRPLHFLAALVPRHGPGRLHAVADGHADSRSII